MRRRSNNSVTGYPMPLKPAKQQNPPRQPPPAGKPEPPTAYRALICNLRLAFGCLTLTLYIADFVMRVISEPDGFQSSPENTDVFGSLPMGRKSVPSALHLQSSCRHTTGALPVKATSQDRSHATSLPSGDIAAPSILQPIGSLIFVTRTTSLPDRLNDESR